MHVVKFPRATGYPDSTGNMNGVIMSDNVVMISEKLKPSKIRWKMVDFFGLNARSQIQRIMLDDPNKERPPEAKATLKVPL